MKTKIIVIGTALLALFFTLSYCGNKYDEERFKEELKQNEKAKVIIDIKKKTVTKITRKADGTVETKVIKGVRKVAVTVSNDNKLTVEARNKGVVFEPGLSLFYSKDRMNLGLDVQFLYWSQYGLNAGFGMSQSYNCSFYLAGNYNFYSNSALFIGVNDELNVVGGLKVAF